MFYFSIFFSPSSLIIISRYRKGILLPSPTGRGKQPKGCAGVGLFFFPPLQRGGESSLKGCAGVGLSIPPSHSLPGFHSPPYSFVPSLR